MLIYNTTYVVGNDDLACFLAWAKDRVIPAVHADGTLHSGRLARILGQESGQDHRFSLQFCTANTADLHKWYLRQGKELQQELQKVFGDRVMGFSTLMEVME